MKKVLLLAALGAALIGVSAAQAISPSAHSRSGHIWVMLHGRHVHAAGTASGSGELLYHGGPVMHTNTIYAIYWVPPGYSMESGYSTLIDQYFTDVAADSFKQSNVYYTATQYYDSVNHVQYHSAFAGSYTDTTPLPAGHCTDSHTPVCLTDSQLRAEIQKDIAANGWPANPSTEFFLFTAKGVGSCAGSTYCAFSNYCGYHSVIGSGTSEILYANMPYADTVRSICDAGQHPNANSADATINIVSHEHNETITDPRGTAWFDSSGDENGDKCAWVFGALTGLSGAKWNQTINGHHYFLQEEYSNQRNACIQSGI